MRSLLRILAALIALAVVYSNNASAQPTTSGSIHLVATVQCTDIALTWTVSPPDLDVQEYHVYGGTSPSSLTQLAVTRLTSYILAGPTPGATYYFVVEGLLAGGGSISSNTATAAVPVKSISLAGVPQSRTAIVLTWTVAQNCQAIPFYRVFEDSVEIAETRQTAYVARGLTPGATYYFKVRGGGVNSNGVSVTLPATR